jgi:hypothetical protein
MGQPRFSFASGGFRAFFHFRYPSLLFSPREATLAHIGTKFWKSIPFQFISWISTLFHSFLGRNNRLARLHAPFSLLKALSTDFDRFNSIKHVMKMVFAFSFVAASACIAFQLGMRK